MMRRLAAHGTYGLVVLLALTGCGGALVGGGNSEAPATDKNDPLIVTVNCPEEVVELVETLEDLDSRLNVGLNFGDYSERVGDARVAYDRIDADELDSGCVQRVGIPAEDAMNAYIEAYKIWNDCIGDIDCDNDSITPDLQAKWADATELVEEASDGLDQ